jgi:hypothetical protein
MPITTNVVCLNPAHGEVYSLQHYVILFVCDLRQVCFSLGTPYCTYFCIMQQSINFFSNLMNTWDHLVGEFL